MLGVIGLILAIIFLMVFAYKGLGALPLAMAGALIAVILTICRSMKHLPAALCRDMQVRLPAICFFL